MRQRKAPRSSAQVSHVWPIPFDQRNYVNDNKSRFCCRRWENTARCARSPAVGMAGFRIVRAPTTRAHKMIIAVSLAVTCCRQCERLCARHCCLCKPANQGNYNTPGSQKPPLKRPATQTHTKRAEPFRRRRRLVMAPSFARRRRPAAARNGGRLTSGFPECQLRSYPSLPVVQLCPLEPPTRSLGRILRRDN